VLIKFAIEAQFFCSFCGVLAGTLVRPFSDGALDPVFGVSVGAGVPNNSYQATARPPERIELDAVCFDYMAVKTTRL
jgi:hypothetical protein